MTIPSRPALRYHGGKWRLAKWIIAQFPGHECYTEVFGGSAAVLLQKPRSWLEVYNDLDGEVVNFFRVLRERSADLVNAINLTPYAKAEWELSLTPADDPLEAARRLYVRAYMSIAGPTAQWNPGWRRQTAGSVIGVSGHGTPDSKSFMSTRHLYQVAERLRGVQIESDDALAILERYDTPETLHYVDPPYVTATRSRRKDAAYLHEMTDGGHVGLSEALLRCAGMVVLSGYACPLYADIYEVAGWRRLDREARVNGPGSRTESLWLSPNCDRLPLFRGLE